ncbi:MAG: glycosyltransferase [Candidatus Aminicenantes bacterium]|nr:glycosyltransferase [Candidatus Aminicenantes bacterium]
MFEILMTLLVTRSALEIFTNVHFGPLQLNIPSLTGLAVLSLAAWLFVRRKKVAWHPIATGWVVWLVVLIPFVFLSWRSFGREGLMAAREWVRLLSIAAVFLLAYNLPSREGRRNGLRLLFFGLPIPLAAALYQLIFRKGWVVGMEYRLMGTLSHPNSLGVFLLFFIALTYWKSKISPHPLWTILIAIEMIFLVGTLNIGGFIMLAALCAWIFLREEPRGRMVVLGLFTLFALMVLINRQAPAKIKTFETAVRTNRPALVSDQTTGPITPSKIIPAVRPRPITGSLGWRFANWDNLIGLWKKKPWLGYGLHMTSLINPWKTDQKIGFAPHNDFIRYLLETGAIGLVAFCGFILFSSFQILKAARRAPPARGAPLLWILAGVFLAWQVGSLGDNLISTTVFQFYLWAALGFALREQKDGEDLHPADGSPRPVWTTVYPIDDQGVKMGGVETFIRQFVRSTPCDGEIRIIGITAKNGGLKTGVWHSISFEDKTVRFLPVLRVADPNRRTRIPLFLRFTAALLFRANLPEGEGGLWLFHRIEPVLAFGRIPGTKILFLHGDPRHLADPRCESRWRRIRRLYARLERRLIIRLDKVFVVSRPALEAMRKLHPSRSNRFAFLPTVYDSAVFRLRPDADRKALRERYDLPREGPVVLSVGRLEAGKDPHLLLDAFRSLSARHPGVRLAIVGCGGLESALKAKSEELGLAESVHWLGLRTPGEVADLMTAADALLLTSAFEAMPVAVLEALACGLPVVSPDLGELRSMVTNETAGLLTASRDPDELAAAVATVLARPRPAGGGASRVAEFAADAVFPKLVAELWERARTRADEAS